jgi:tRNA G18 (ribose-2'-O)-methylase SpoU
MGAVFQLAACRVLEYENELDAIPPARLVGLDAHAGTPLEDFAFLPDDVLVLGSESHGLRVAESRLTARLRIPGSGRLESLNVGHAMAVCAWERFRRGTH